MQQYFQDIQGLEELLQSNLKYDYFFFLFFYFKKVNVLLNNKINKKISEEINVHKDIALLRQDFSLGTGKKPKARTFRKNDKMDVILFFFE